MESLRPTRFVVTLAAGVLLATPTRAQTQLGTNVLTGELELGGRILFNGYGSAKFNEYRDYDSGFFQQGWLNFEDDQHRYFFDFDTYFIGPQDQWYRGDLGRYGRYGLTLQYQEYPHEYFTDSTTIYNTGTNFLSLQPPGVQSTLSSLAGAARSQALEDFVNGGHGDKIGIEYKEGGASAFYRFSENLEARAEWDIQKREGTSPYSLGSFFTNFVNFPGPRDDETNNVTGTLEWAAHGMSLAASYEGSFYHDGLSSITIENPLVETDTRSSSSLWRSAAPPDNEANVFSLTGAANIPVGFPVHATTTLSYGRYSQDDHFLPYTINSALAGALAPPSHDSANASVNTWLANALLTARPTDRWDVQARYRLFAYDNETPTRTLPGEVVSDSSLSTTPIKNVANGFTTQTADVNATYRLLEPLSWNIGYSYEHWRRTQDREVRNQGDNTIDTWLEWRLLPSAKLRGTYAFSLRDDYSSYNPATPDQNPELRKFDEAQLHRHAFDLLFQATPRENLDVTLSSSLWYDDYDANYGIRSDVDWNAGTQIAWRPLAWLAFSAGYVYENWGLNMRSQQRNSPVVIVGDWRSDQDGYAHNVTARADVTVIPKRLDLGIDYLWQKSSDDINTNGTAGLHSQNLNYPSDRNTLQILTGRIDYHPFDHWTLRASYSWQRYGANYFQWQNSPFLAGSNVTTATGAVAPSSDIFFGGSLKGYAASVVGLSVRYAF